MKICIECLQLKDLSLFGVESRKKDGRRNKCKECINKYYKEIYPKIKIKKSKTQKEYYKKNKEIIKIRSKNYNLNLERKKLYNKIWMSENKLKRKDKANQYEKNRTKIDLDYRLIKIIRKILYRTLNNKTDSTFNILGYTKDELIKSLGRCPNINESIDHKIPISWFLPNTDIRLINSLYNLQILTKSENSIKSNKFSHEINEIYYIQIYSFIKPKYLNLITYGK